MEEKLIRRESLAETEKRNERESLLKVATAERNNLLREITSPLKPDDLPFPDTPKAEWDEKSDLLEKYSEKSFLKFESRKVDSRLKIHTVNGKKITLFNDNDIYFYKVKSGDTLGGIEQRISKIPGFEYVKDLPDDKKQSFNIPADGLVPGVWIPIPLEKSERVLSDEQFANYCTDAIDEMKKDKNYGKDVLTILKKIPEKELITFMIAVAKQESGGRPLGQFEFHRWEKSFRCFSFSIYHVLMSGPGLTARKNLMMTEGQTYHPKNASKLFLAFLIEKSKETKDPDKSFARFLPIMENLESFASFYNGTNWETKNPKYAENLKKYYQDAATLWDKKVPSPTISPDSSITATSSKKPIIVPQDSAVVVPPSQKETKELIAKTKTHYVIEEGDTLGEIAAYINKNQFAGVQEIKKLNPGIKSNSLSVGKKINIPAKTITVPNAPIKELLKKYYPEWDEEIAIKAIKKLNKLDPKTDKIKPGMKIIVPTRAG